jgi:hypothetical protein
LLAGALVPVLGPTGATVGFTFFGPPGALIGDIIGTALAALTSSGISASLWTSTQTTINYSYIRCKEECKEKYKGEK